MPNKTRVKFVFQNIDGDGAPTQTGAVVGLVESPQDMSLIRKWSLPKHDFYRADMNYRVTAFVKPDKFDVDRVRSVLVHKAGRIPPTPRRTFLVLDGVIGDWEVRVLVGHAVNSAWAPKWKPTSFRKRRRTLWHRWHNTAQRLIDEGHDQGRLVILLVDGNRSRGQWGFRGMSHPISHGPDEVFISQGHKSKPDVSQPQIGARTGNGRVTHASLGFTLALEKRHGRVS